MYTIGELISGDFYSSVINESKTIRIQLNAKYGDLQIINFVNLCFLSITVRFVVFFLPI